jgi:hypothetical protein
MAIVISIFGALAVICLAAIYYLGDLGNILETMSAKEISAAFRDVRDPDQFEQVLKQHPSSKIAKLITLARQNTIDLDTAARKLLAEAEPKSLPKLIDAATASREDLDALRQRLKGAQASAAAVPSRYAAQAAIDHDKLAREARGLNADDDTLSRFIALLDEQTKERVALVNGIGAASADYYGGYEKCVVLLITETGRYKVANGQFVFPFQSTANSYNAAATGMAAATQRLAALEDERVKLQQSQMNRWKALAEK